MEVKVSAHRKEERQEKQKGGGEEARKQYALSEREDVLLEVVERSDDRRNQMRMKGRKDRWATSVGRMQGYPRKGGTQHREEKIEKRGWRATNRLGLDWSNPNLAKVSLG
jgi:hypothetical protein